MMDTNRWMYSNLHSRRSSRGFTLIEVMAAMVILATGLLAIILLRNETLKLNAEAQNVLRAVQLAEQKLSEFEIQGFPKAPMPIPVPFPEADGYNWQVSLEPVSLGGRANLMRLDLVVSYPTIGEKGALVITTGYALK